MASSFDLTGQRALVTGCNRGIGQAMALGLAEAGADIIGVSATLAADGGDTGHQVRALGRQFHAYQADFSQRPSADAFTQQVLADFERLDILINNAGTIRRSPAAEHPDAEGVHGCSPR